MRRTRTPAGVLFALLFLTWCPPPPRQQKAPRQDNGKQTMALPVRAFNVWDEVGGNRACFLLVNTPVPCGGTEALLLTQLAVACCLLLVNTPPPCSGT